MDAMKSSRRRWVLGVVAAVVLGLSAFPRVRDNLVGYYDYFFHDGPYVGSRLAKIPVLVKDDDFFRTLAEDAGYEDYRRSPPHFNRPLEQQVTAPHTPAEVEAYGAFLASYQDDIASTNGKRTDALAFKIVERVHKAYVQNTTNSRLIEDGYLGSRNSRAEEYVFFLVNAQTFCGTVGESAVALLRNAGFKARMVILSDQAERLEVNHVFAEFFSEESRHWIMIDPMVGFVPSLNGRYLSAFEFLRTPEAVLAANLAWEEINYRTGAVMWFDRWGPIRYQYYYTADKAAREHLKQVL